MGAYKPLDQSDVAGDLAARIFRGAGRSSRGRGAIRGQRLLALEQCGSIKERDCLEIVLKLRKDFFLVGG